MAQKVLGAYVDQSLWSLSYTTEMLTLAPLPKNFGGSKFFVIFSLLASQNLNQWFLK